MRSLVYIQTLTRTAKLFSILWFMLFVALHTASAQEVRYNYDAAGRLIGIVDQQGRTLIYEYDALGNLLGVRRQDTVAQVAITLVTPDKGFIGTQVQIFGVGFSAVASENAISFNGVPALVLAATTTSLTTEVPIGATTGFITVKTPLGSATSPQPFTVLGGISVSPSKVTLVRGNSQQFIATVTGVTDQRVVWSVNGIDGGNSSVGTITADGLYTAAFINTTSLTVTIKATSVVFSDLSATATVNIIVTCSVTWTGAGGNNLWQNSANWSTKVLPGANDDACIGTGFSVTLSSGTQSIRSLTSDSPLSIAAGTLSIANTSSINHNFTLSAGALDGAGSVTISGVTTWTGGAMSGTGTTTLNGNLAISGNGSHDLTGGRTLNTTATTTMTGGGASYFRTGGGASINNSGTWLDQTTTNAEISNAFGGTQSTFRNTGVYRKSGAATITTISNITFNNTSSGAGTGVVDVLNGTLNLSGGGTANTGSTFTGASGTTLGFGGGTYSLQTGSSVSAATVTFFGSGTTNINGTYSATATTANSGDVNFNPGATVNSVGALTISNGASTVTFNTGTAIAPTTLTLSAGTLAGPDLVTISGLTTWSGGVMTGTGTTTLNGNVTMSGSGHDLSGGRTLNTTATTTMSGGVAGFLRIGGGAIINNSGTWLDQTTSGSTISFLGGTPSTFSNTGTYRKSIGTAATTFSIEFNNTSSGAGTGVVDVLNGTMNFTGGGTANSGSTFTGASGTTLGFGGGTYSLQTGSSVSAATVTFSGSGTTNVNGTYSATATTANSGDVNFNPGATVNSVGALTISNGASMVTFNTGTAIAPTTLILSAGTLAGTDVVSVSGATTWTGGVMTGTGTTTLNGNVTITGNNFHDLNGGRTLNTTGTTTISGGFNDFFRTAGGASINNSGLWQDQSSLNYGITGTQSTFRNTGIYRKSSGGGATTIGITFNNTSTGAGTGVVEVLSGSLNLTGGGTANSGSTFTGTTGTVLGFGGGTYLLEIGSSVSGATVSFGDGTANINGTYSATATSVVGRAIVNFNPGATVTSVGALTIGSGFGGTANFNTGSLITPTTLTLIGALTGSDPVTVSGLTTWTGGTMSGTGTTTLNGNVTISGNAAHDLTGGRTLNTTATTTTSGGFTGFFRTGGGASINNSGVWQDQFTGSSTISNDFGGTQSTFRNTGTYRKSVGSATTTIGLIFNSSGTVEIQTGTLRFTGGYTQTTGETKLNGGALSSTTTLNIQGGKLSGAGTVTANVSNAAQVNPGASPGILNITGTYTQTAAGTLNIEIGGLTAGTQYDRLAISGAATLSGTLKIDLIGGFAPSPGNTFQIMTFSSHSGTFTTTNVPGFVVNVNATNVTAAAP